MHEKIRTGQPTYFVLNFPLTNVKPIITEITYNDRRMCAADEYPPPSTWIQPGIWISLQELIPMEHIKDTNADLLEKPSSSDMSQNLSDICGREIGAAAFEPLIYGGTALRRGQFPWLTAIYEKSGEGVQFLCGGSLISSRMILSAAHCFELKQLSADRIVVYLGRHNLTNYMESDMVVRNILNIHISPEYKADAFHDADVALLEMVTPVLFTNYIRPICLWTEPAQLSLITGIDGVVAGWGSDEAGKSVSQVPKSVQVTIVSNESCLRSLPVFNLLTSSRTLCAGKRDDTGPCKGDSGGGLVIFRNGRWVLRAIVSTGLTRNERCNLREYTVYCDVAHHMVWLQTVMNKQN